MGFLSKSYTAWNKSLENRQERIKTERKERNRKERPKSKPGKRGLEMKEHDDVRLWDRDQFFDKYKDWKTVATIGGKDIKVFDRSHVHNQVELWSKRHATWYQDNLLPIELWCIKHDDAIDMVVTSMVWGFSFLFLWWLKQNVTIPKVY